MHVIARRRLAAHFDVRRVRERRQRPAAARALLAVQIDAHLDASRRCARQGIDDAAISQNKSGEIDGPPRAANQTFVDGPEPLAGTVKQPYAGDDRLGRKKSRRLRTGRNQKNDERDKEPDGRSRAEPYARGGA